MGKRKVVVIGGGLSGLAASYDLVRSGFHVTLLEGAPDFGGLASSSRIESIPVERFYHFICRSDDHLLKLVEEFKLSHKVYWRGARTSFYYEGKRFPFGTPFDLLGFSAVPWSGRIRFGLHVLRSKYRKEWRHLDRIPAKKWLIDNLGEKAYEVIWQPLLKVKFGDDHDKISAAWMWHRIWRVANSRTSVLEPDLYGCLEYGTATLVDPLVEWLKGQPDADIRTSIKAAPLVIRDDKVVQVRAGDQVFECDAVVSTAALPSLARLLPDRMEGYFERVRHVRYLGVVCMLISLKRQFSDNFWTNVNDARISFNGVIEQTELNRNLRDRGLNLLYIPFYLPTTAPRYTATNEELFREYVPMLKMVNPAFDESQIKEWHVYRNPYAQPIFETGFLDYMPNHRAPVKGLYVTDSTQFYPEDRTISAAISQGRKVAGMIRDDFR
jgi:protoporphyrinogen oxidase